MSNLQSASFELTAPSTKRARFEHPQTDILRVEQEQPGVSSVAIATEEVVPSSQFEIEINSQDGEREEISELEATDLGPTFGIVEATQEVHSLEGIGSPEDGGTLSAIGHALVQMQQGAQAAPSSMSSQLLLARNSAGSETGQNAPLYVMIPPASSAELLQVIGQSKTLAPKTGLATTGTYVETIPSSAELAANREALRKATHNEVERRRRDRINELIKVLAQLVPACQKKDAATGSIVGYVYSKGTVLDKTVEYVKELVAQNEQLSASAKLAEKSAGALAMLQNQISVLEKENAFLRAQIIQFGIDAAASSGQKQGGQPLLNTPLAQSILNSVTQPTVTNSSPPQSSQQNSNAAAQQLLLSLAQSLTNSPLLTSLSQTQQPDATIQSVGGAMPSSQISNVLQGQVGTGQSSLVSGTSTPLLTSLVQTLSSIANTTTSSATPPPKPAVLPQANSSGGLSAAAAASLLNTLILAQNVLSNTNGSAQSNAQTMLTESPIVDEQPQ